MPIPCWREPVFPEKDDQLFVDFIGVGNSINFAYKDFETRQSYSSKYKDQDWRGAFGMWACLKRALENGLDVVNGKFLRDLNKKQCEEIFAGSMRMPLLDERYEILREVGRVLTEKYGGSFSKLFEEANSKAFGAGGVVGRLISEFPSFRDESPHKASGALLRFHKRAQLFAMMYQGRAHSSVGLAELADYENLGPIADYIIPRNLHAAGILRYSPELERKIMSSCLIEKDSVEEQDIRAQATHAQVRLLKEIDSQRTVKISTLQLDFKLWAMYSGVKEPHHLTKTTAY